MAKRVRKARNVELRRKKLALLAFWNRLALELRGPHAEDSKANLITAGRLLELCKDHQGRFETRARKFLGESWRTYRHLGSLYKNWEALGDPRKESPRESFAKVQEASSVPEGPNWRGYVTRPEWWDDPKNLSTEAFRAKLREVRENLRSGG